MDPSELSAWLKSRQIAEIYCVIPDLSGAARGKSMTPSVFLNSIKNDGLRLAEPVMTINIFGEYTFNDYVRRSERDIFLRSDFSTLHQLPWNKDKTACVVCDVFHADGKPFQLASREILKTVIGLYEQRGWRPIVGPEVEFYLIAKFKGHILEPEAPLGVSGLSEFGQHSFGVDSIDEFDDFFEELYDYCELQDIPLDTLIHEDGPCQFEVNLSHTDALRVADQLFLFKRAARHAARRHDMFVSFMAKPYGDESGSSMHLHQSIVDADTGKNIFADDDGEDSTLFRHYVGGLQSYLRDAMPFFAPYTNSYNRFEAYMSAPTNVHWSRENRTVGLRVPESTPQARRVENRIAGSDVNPYLALAATLLCGYVGMVDGIERRAEFVGNAYEDTARAVPDTLTEAVKGFRKSEMLRKYLGDAIVDTYADLKETEYENRSRILSPWDVQYLMVNV
ncbi:MAG: glutamine synthetase family protein [Pseudomonadota bacterium]